MLEAAGVSDSNRSSCDDAPGNGFRRRGARAAEDRCGVVVRVVARKAPLNRPCLFVYSYLLRYPAHVRPHAVSSHGFQSLRLLAVPSRLSVSNESFIESEELLAGVEGAGKDPQLSENTRAYNASIGLQCTYVSTVLYSV